MNQYEYGIPPDTITIWASKFVGWLEILDIGESVADHDFYSAVFLNLDLDNLNNGEK